MFVSHKTYDLLVSHGYPEGPIPHAVDALEWLRSNYDYLYERWDETIGEAAIGRPCWWAQRRGERGKSRALVSGTAAELVGMICVEIAERYSGND